MAAALSTPRPRPARFCAARRTRGCCATNCFARFSPPPSPRAPSALALTTLERRYSYREVDLFATAIAKGLVERGVGPGDVVGLWMARGPELLIAQIAIAKTGAAWLPFDADAPVERIAVCLSDAEAKGLLTSAAFARKAGGGVTAPVLIDAEHRDDGRRAAARSARSAARRRTAPPI